MVELKNIKECAGAFVANKLVCAHCLTEADITDMDGVLSEEELEEAKQYQCSRCYKEIKSKAGE